MGLIKDLFSKKHSIKVSIEAKNGLHLRPCAKIATLAKKFDSDISFISSNKTIDAKNMNEILALGLEYGSEITIITKGKGAKDALFAIKSLLNELSNHDISVNDDKIISIYDKIQYESETINTDVICGGICVAKTYYQSDTQSDTQNDINYVNNKIEFHDAINKVTSELEMLLADEENSEKDIFLAQKAILNTLNNSSFEMFENSISNAIKMLENTANQSKIVDYKDIKKRVFNKMNGVLRKEFPLNDFILVSNELFPSDIKRLAKSGVKGVIINNISSRSHIALLLRSYNIPSVSVKDIARFKNIDNQIILDANNKVIAISPSSKDIDTAMSSVKKSNEKSEKDNNDKFKIVATKSGKRIKILANIADYESAIEAKEAGCDGIGLLRTEFLFQVNKPTLEEQTSEYAKIFKLFDEVTVRTLDVGGDKKLPYLIIPNEENPFLGVRGIRLFKTHLDLIKEQLLAILLAKSSGEVKIMFPMVSTVDEFIYAKSVAVDIANEHNIDLSGISFGIMVEVPSVLFLISEFNKVVDFYSIGTNDLLQYLFAVDRTHTSLEIDTRSGVLFDAIKLIQEQSIKPVSICGELASDIEAIKALIDINIEILSVTPAMVSNIKSRIRDV
jgi:phosphocarrier protein FPr